ERTACPFDPRHSRSIPSRTWRNRARYSALRSATSIPAIGLPDSTQSHISWPEANVGRSAIFDGAQRAGEETQELELRGRAIRGHEDMSARLRNPNHLTERARLVRHEHDSELRSGDVEAVVWNVQRMTIHDASLSAAQTLRA